MSVWRRAGWLLTLVIACSLDSALCRRVLVMTFSPERHSQKKAADLFAFLCEGSSTDGTVAAVERRKDVIRLVELCVKRNNNSDYQIQEVICDSSANTRYLWWCRSRHHKLKFLDHARTQHEQPLFRILKVESA